MPRRPSLLWAVLTQRCCRCRMGRMFHGRLAMHPTCPVCGMRFQRDEGYFLGAMYVSYFLATIILGLGLIVGHALLPTWNLAVLLLVIVYPCFLLLVPMVFRYSRVIWIYFDRWASPSDMSTPENWERFCRMREKAEP